ncbi:MAG: CoxG family protein, partial [Nitrososphaerota archaeon]
MDISDSYTLHAAREQVWDTLLAADTLKQSVPGCDSLEQTDANAYAVHMNVTIPEISGAYDGTLRLLDMQKPETLRMVVDSAGARGTLHSDTTLRLEAKDAATTVVHCSGQTQLGGAIASVGAEAAAGTASTMIRQSLEQLAHMLPESSSVLAAADLSPAPASISLPAPTEVERPARRRRTTNSKPKDQQATKKA